MTSLAAALATPWPLARGGLAARRRLRLSALDAVGNIPFLRAVRARERAQMTTVFRTYLDISELLPPALFALLLSFFGLASVFLATGLWMLAIARHGAPSAAAASEAAAQSGMRSSARNSGFSPDVHESTMARDSYPRRRRRTEDCEPGTTARMQSSYAPGNP